MNRKRKWRFSIAGTLLQSIYFLIIVTISIFVYNKAVETFPGRPFVVFLLIALCILFFSLTSGLLDIARRKWTIDQPVEKITDFTSLIAKGDFKSRLPLEENRFSPLEFSLIADNLNKMAEELEKNEVLKEDFISNVSHEMKTPLAILSGYAKALQDPNLDEATRKKYLQTILTTANNLSQLVKNILSLSRLENQKIFPDMQMDQADEILSETILLYEDKIEEKNIQLECDIDDVRFVSEPSFLKIVYSNILSNAVKFTKDGGKILVSLKKKDDEVVFKVQDEGTGIHKENLPHIFEKFYQEDTSHAKNGNGLGLALVQKVIDRLGGTIEVESQVGVGTTFVITQKLKEEGQ